jgi:hypothetical protein
LFSWYHLVASIGILPRLLMSRAPEREHPEKQ